MNLLLDTHALLWWLAGGSRLSARAAGEIARAAVVYVSPISFWETALLVARGRLTLDRDLHAWALDLLDEDRVELAPLSPQAAIGAALFDRDGFHGDPADRFLCATARDLAIPLVTKDRAIRGYGASTRQFRTIW